MFTDFFPLILRGVILLAGCAGAFNAHAENTLDFDQALRLRPDDVELLVLRAAAWRNARNPAQAMADVVRALRIAPDHTEALLERGFITRTTSGRAITASGVTRVLRLEEAAVAA